MSSILKALKKVEESTSRDLDAPDFGGSRRRGALRYGLQEQWHQARRLGYGLLVAAMLCAAALIYFALQADGPPGAGNAAGAGKPGKEFRAKLAAPGPRAETAPRSPPAGPADPAERVITMRADPAAPTAPGPSVFSPAARVPGGTAAKEIPDGAPQPRARPFAARPPAPSSPPAARPEQPAPARAPEDGLSRLDDSKLKVMAIAWSNDPARRVAVVNGHILKEGESVDGYSITQIRKDDIIVREGSRSWRVEFNLKTQP